MAVKEYPQVSSLLEQFSAEDFDPSIVTKHGAPTLWLSQCLPPRMQFTPAVYVAVSQEKVLGLICVRRDGKTVRRWKIEQVIVNPDVYSYDVGAQLVNFVINRYGAEGGQTFLATVHHQCDHAQSILKTCGFRHVTRLHTYCHPNVSEIRLAQPPENLEAIQSFDLEEPSTLTSLRDATNHDRFKLKELDDDGIPTDMRSPLERSPKDFTQTPFEQLGNKLKGHTFIRRLVCDPVHEVFLGAYSIHTLNGQDFTLKVTVSPGWVNQYPEFLKTALQQVISYNDQASVHLGVYSFQKEHIQTLEALGFERQHESEVLVKDYWVPLADSRKRHEANQGIFAEGGTAATSYLTDAKSS